MPRTPKLPKENARYWIDEARRELRVANDYRGDPDMALIRCARAHAAVELAIKAVIIVHDKGYPDTHNVGLLLDRAEQVGETIGHETKTGQQTDRVRRPAAVRSSGASSTGSTAGQHGSRRGDRNRQQDRGVGGRPSTNVAAGNQWNLRSGHTSPFSITVKLAVGVLSDRGWFT